ncbi:MAG: hypothetical protein V7642_751 [Burkholderiales bacterium]|jgi:Flp pilus assembly protein TadD
MKTYAKLLPLVCGVSVLQACMSLAYAAPTTMSVEPVMVVRHSEPGIDTWYVLGRHHQRNNRLDRAAEAYRHVLAHDARHAAARNALATVYSMQGRFDEAVAEFQTVLRENPGLAYVHSNLGYAYYLKKDYPAAVATLGTALSLEPANTRAFGNLALAYGKIDATGSPGSSAPRAPASALTQAPQESGEADLAAPLAVEEVLAQSPDQQADAAPATEQVAPPASTPILATGIAIEIANGTREAQLAERLSVELQREGVTVTRVTPLKPHTQRRTVILYRDGFRAQALELSRSFAAPPAVVNNTRTRKPHDKSNIRLVLGKSAAQATVVANAGVPAAGH